MLFKWVKQNYGGISCHQSSTVQSATGYRSNQFVSKTSMISTPDKTHFPFFMIESLSGIKWWACIVLVCCCSKCLTFWTPIQVKGSFLREVLPIGWKSSVKRIITYLQLPSGLEALIFQMICWTYLQYIPEFTLKLQLLIQADIPVCDPNKSKTAPHQLRSIESTLR